MAQTVRRHRERMRTPLRRSLGLTLALVLLFTAFLLPGMAPIAAYADDPNPVTVQVKGSFAVESTRQMLDNINDLRANDAWYWNSSNTEKVYVSDLEPLVYDYRLERVAMQRAAELAVYYAHTRPNGETCFAAYPDEFGWASCGENIAYASFAWSVDGVFTAWAEADKYYEGQGHRRNMLNKSFKSVGIACFACEGYTFWVQEFSSLTTNASSDPLTSPVSV